MSRYPHLWALIVPVGLGLAAWILGMLLFDVVGAGYFRSVLARLFRA